MRFNGAAGAAALASRDISVSEAARCMGIDRSHLSNILNGHRGAGAEMVRKFAEYLNLSPMTFIGPDDPRSAVVQLARIYKVRADELDAA